MTKRSPITGYPGSGSAPPSPFTAWTPGTEGSESKQRNAASSEVKPELKRGKSLEKKHSLETWRQDSHFIHLFGNLLKVRAIELINHNDSLIYPFYSLIPMTSLDFRVRIILECYKERFHRNGTK